MTKKIICAALAALMSVSMLAACTSSDEQPDDTTTTTEAATTTTTAASEDTSATTEDTSSGSTEDNGAQSTDGAITAIHQAVKDAYGDEYYPNMPVEDEMFEDTFGVSLDDVDDYVAEMPMISVNVDTFVAIKAKSGKADAVEEALNAYRDKLVNDTMQYPSNLPKIQGSKVYKQGDYVFFIMLGEIPMEVLDESDEAAIKAAEENNQKAIAAIDDAVAAL